MESDATVQLDVQQDSHKGTPPKGGKSNLKIAAIGKRFAGVQVMLFIIAAALFFFEGRLPVINTIDTVLFNTSSALKGSPEIKYAPVIITLPPDKLENLQRTPDNFPEFIALIKKLSREGVSAIGLIVSELPLQSRDTSVEKIEKKIADTLENSAPDEKTNLNRILKYSQNFLVRGKALTDSLNKAGAVVAIRQGYGITENERLTGNYLMDRTVRVSPPPVNTYLDNLPEHSLPTLLPVVGPSDNKAAAIKRLAPVGVEDSGISWPLIWTQGDTIVPDVCTLMYSRMLKDTPEWKTGSGVMFGFSFVATDNAGYVKPHFIKGDAGGEIKTYSFDEILQSKNPAFLKRRPVLIGGEQDPVTERAACTLLSLASGAVSSTPYQAVWLSKCLIVLIFVYLIVVIPRLRPGVSVLISLFVIFSGVIVQFGFHIIRDQWLILITPALFLTGGHLVMLIRQNVNNRFEGLRQKSDKAFFELGMFQYEQSRHDQAFDSLKQCYPAPHVLEVLYKLGISLERKRQFDKACSVFNYIVDISPDHRDSNEKAERLSNMLFGRSTTVSNGAEGHLVLTSPGMARPVLGRYEIEGELGRGAMGIVYLGTDPKIGRKIAIKTMDFTQTFEGRFDEVKGRFFREAMAAGRLTHPNIVTIFDAGEEQDLAYIAMDYVEGNPLSSYTSDERLLPPDTVFELMAQVADALDYAHKQSIIHRDIKPGNIIYNPEGKVIKVTDFGIARIADTTTTRPGVVVGSPSFMAPEQLKGLEIDGRADIFSLGVTFFQLLTGKLPFTGTDLSSLGYQITSVKQPSVLSLRAGLPKIADSIISKALQKSPEKRYKSAAGMARSLRSKISKNIEF